jgi:hypothetical protein
MQDMSRRRAAGNETWFRLREWNKGQADSERLASHILRVEGFTSIDPIHPLGGKDGLRDVICERNGRKWIGACYFPRGQQTFNAIRKKFSNDLKGVAESQVEGMALVTNQELTLAERAKLKDEAGDAEIEIFHLERIASILDSPNCYGLRLEYLDIKMSKEEQLSLITKRDSLLKDVKSDTEIIISLIKHPELLNVENPGEALKTLKAFRFLLDNSDWKRNSYRSLIEGLFESLDGAIPILIKSETFEDFIERATGAKPEIRQYDESLSGYEVTEGRLSLDQKQMDWFIEAHSALRETIDGQS